MPKVPKQLTIKGAIHIDWEQPTTLNQELHHVNLRLYSFHVIMCFFCCLVIVYHK